MQVADILADSKLEAWMTAVADHIKRSDWRFDEENSTALCALLSLPQHLLTGVMRSFSDGEARLRCPTAPLPLCLHGPLLSSCVTKEGHLNIGSDYSSDPLVAAGISRSQINLPRPGLLGLSLSPCLDLDSASTFTSVVNSIASHTTITSLKVLKTTRLIPEPALIVLCNALPDLANLKQLELNHGTFSPAALGAFARALRQLQSLENLTMSRIRVQDAPLNTAEPASYEFVQVPAIYSMLLHRLAFHVAVRKATLNEHGSVYFDCDHLAVPVLHSRMLGALSTRCVPWFTCF
jgi:hypothetical protein